MPECSNCGAHVSSDFYRVFAVRGDLEHCPSCPDKANSDLGSGFSPGK